MVLVFDPSHLHLVFYRRVVSVHARFPAEIGSVAQVSDLNGVQPSRCTRRHAFTPCWGIVATWWFALPLGVALASAARLGDRPRLTALQLVKPVLALLGAMAIVALLSGITGYVLAARHSIVPNEWILLNIPGSRQSAFIADWWAHSASYISGFLGGIVLCLYVWRSRSRLS
jgi:hypothetical protein